MARLRRLGDSGRFLMRFLCAAWLVGSAGILHTWASAWPPERHVTGVVAGFGAAAILGVWLLWRTRESGQRELFETSAALGFWAGVFAVVV